MVVRCIIVVMLVSFLIWIISAELNYDGKNEEIFRDFFRFFRKIKLDPGDIALTFNQFLAFYNVSPSSWQEREYREYVNIWFIYKNSNNTEKFRIQFKTYGDQMKYRIWRRNKKKREATLQKVRETNRFIEIIRQQSILMEQEAREEANQLRERIISELEARQ